MVPTMSPEVVKLLAVAGVSMLAGGALGSYATSALLGGGQAPVSPVAKKPPAVQECNCETQTAARQVDPLAAGRIPEDLTEVRGTTLPGLPVSALNLARAAAQRELQPCATSGDAYGEGTLVLTLTVTATGGQGFIRQARVTAQSGDSDWARECVLERSRRVRFEWSGADGQQTLKLPIRVGE